MSNPNGEFLRGLYGTLGVDIERHPPLSEGTSEETPDLVNHPPHYTSHPSGIECISITEYMGFNVGNAIKYLWRADLKGNALEDLRKALWYVEREISKRERDM